MVRGRENKPHIAIYGACNAGKSTLINFITSTDASIVSPVGGTTTDTVRRGYEIRDFAPVVFLDTAGLDDTTQLGADRRRRTEQSFGQVDAAVVVFRQWGECESVLAVRLCKEGIPFIAIHNLFKGDEPSSIPNDIEVISADLTRSGDQTRDIILENVKRIVPAETCTPMRMFGDAVGEGDVVVLVCPIDSAAPAGRLILPQVQALRELLDAGAVGVTVQPPQLPQMLASGLVPRMVVADSQVLREVRTVVPAEIEVTSFSILLAAAKGDPEVYKRGLEVVSNVKTGANPRLHAGDRVLICENCLHQSSCDDIGRVKIPRWLEAYCGFELRFEFVSGVDPLPDNLGDYALVVQCGGCMVTRRQLHSRIRAAVAAGVPITNYGMLIRLIT